MKKQLIRKIALTCVPFFLLFLFLSTTDPYKLSLPLLFVPFILIGVGLYNGTLLLSTNSGISKRRARFVAGTLTGGVLMAVLLLSVGQFSLRDFSLLFVLLIGALYYIRRIDL